MTGPAIASERSISHGSHDPRPIEICRRPPEFGDGSILQSENLSVPLSDKKRRKTMKNPVKNPIKNTQVYLSETLKIP